MIDKPIATQTDDQSGSKRWSTGDVRGADKPTTILPAEMRGIPVRSRAQYEKNQRTMLAARKIREQRTGDDGSTLHQSVQPGQTRSRRSSAKRSTDDMVWQNDHTPASVRSGRQRKVDIQEVQDKPIEPIVNEAGFDGVVDSRVIPDAGLPTELVSGVLELQPSQQGYLRPEYLVSNKDVYVSSSQVRRFGLKHGDMVTGQARQPKENERYWGLLKVEKINDRPAEEFGERPDFEGLESEYPNEQIILATGIEPLSTRVIDLIAPIGKGQRGLIVSPPKAGKTWLLKDVAAGVAANYPDMHLIALLIGERPEEVTDMKKNIKGDVVASHFDHPAHVQVAVAELGLARAKRLVEMGKEVFILMDSITRLARAYNLYGRSSSRMMSGGFSAEAIFPAKRFLGAARKLTSGGSLTILGTALVETGSRMDELIYEEFKGTGNLEIHLERKLAEKRVYPAINVMKSGTRQEELLYDKKIYPMIIKLRRMLSLLDDDERTELLLEKLRKNKNNEEFLKNIDKAG